ncbi:MAG: DUF938 domain-containing protein [Alphaproteobacteria bacterium]|nr:DUF938 domain-containing protein [Alphaproteobacteria bacterium]
MDEKLYSPSAARNSAVIADVLSPVLASQARVLEIGSGTGEHAEAVCSVRPDIKWTPSDPDELSRRSQAARARETGGVQAPLELDVSVPGWTQDLPEFDALVCCNVIHISPWTAAEGLARGAADILGTEGRIFLYGPFLEGADTAPSNLEFDTSLKARNPQWGVRALQDVTQLFAHNGFHLEKRIAMPANNLSLIFSRAQR